MEFSDILSNFAINGEFISCEPYGSGLINRTYVAVYNEGGRRVRYIVQRINTNLFKNVDGLMNNIKLVTEFNRAEIMKRGGDPDRESLTLVPTKNGGTYFRTEEGDCYRVYVFIENAKGYDVVEKPEHFYESAVAFGKFAMLLDRFDSSKLFEVLPDFHNTVKRFDNFKKSLEADKFNRAKDVKKEIEFALNREKITHTIVDLLASGKMPSRVTHNDTKLNNVLIDTRTDKAVSVIDLDTMMPGSICYDFGDSIRFGCNPCLEDTPETEKVIFNMPLFETYTKGYLSVFGDTITDIERKNLPMGAILMTYECGIRFLTDYLDGDVYFRKTREGQNIDRTRSQFKLVSDMEKRYDEMLSAVEKY
ncbi:MAG: aminoglycoside phosphotransferase family protein [Candidatus Borkfalkiaceae bacterium]|nr:aminoglycoside phosphotransferase family protein [Eubacteriales bacterium]MDY5819719.1 aminoglycoside phosphotransferase family protein [Christensenellaceae bacterium]